MLLKCNTCIDNLNDIFTTDGFLTTKKFRKRNDYVKKMCGITKQLAKNGATYQLGRPFLLVVSEKGNNNLSVCLE